MIGGEPGADREFGQPDLRFVGYQEAMKAAGLQVKPGWSVGCDYTIQGAYKVAKQMLGDPRDAPSAIFCASDEMGFGTIMAAKDLGLEVPKDISVIGIDDHDMSDFFGLSTISQSPREQGRKAVEMLLELLRDPDLEDHVNVESTVEWPAPLVVRSSTAKHVGR
jgi:DNA-binding LacI/PurR family transcriptional regulator